jgi:uncharacterized membrane protein
MHTTIDTFARFAIAALLVAVGVISALIGIGALSNLLSDHPDGSISVYVTTGVAGLLGAVVSGLLAVYVLKRPSLGGRAPSRGR